MLRLDCANDDRLHLIGFVVRAILRPTHVSEERHETIHCRRLTCDECPDRIPFGDHRRMRAGFYFFIARAGGADFAVDGKCGPPRHEGSAVLVDGIEDRVGLRLAFLGFGPSSATCRLALRSLGHESPPWPLGSGADRGGDLVDGMLQPGDAELGLPEVPEIDGEPLSYVARIMELKEPEWPVLETVEPPDGMRFWSMSGGTVVRREPPSAAARARADEIIAAHDRWDTKYWRYPREVRSLERQADRASKRKDKLRAKVDRTRAYTVAGLAAKAQVAAIEGEDDTQFADTTLELILRDIRKLNPAALS